MATTTQTSPALSAASAPRITGAVFWKTWRVNGWHGLLWGGLIGLMAWMIVALVPDVDFLEEYRQLQETFPGLIQAFVGGDADFIASTEGYLTTELYSWVVFLVAFFGVLAGLDITANDEASGRIDVLLSMPLPRWQLIVEKALAYVAIFLVIALLAFAGLYAGEQSAGVFNIGPGIMFASMLNLVPTGLFVMTLTAFLGALLRRKSRAVQLSAAWIVASIFVEMLARLAPEAPFAPLRNLSFYYYYDVAYVLQNGLSVLNVGVLLGASVLLLAGSVWAFQRRDLGV